MPATVPISFVDSHTEGEPTRTVVSGIPPLVGSTLAEMAASFAASHDRFRAACVTEPRGSDILVGALLLPPPDRGCDAGVIFFNNVGLLGMCGHGTIGVVRTLAHLRRIDPTAPRRVRLDTPVGRVEAMYEPSASGPPVVEVGNVRSWLQLRGVSLDLPGGRRVTGDIAWGGNWFFLCEDHGEELRLGNAARLVAICSEIRRALDRAGLGWIDGRAVDHVELVGPPVDPANDARNFVLCPGGAYDRSPCGTGTSAKIACLAAHGKLAPGTVWRQESIVGSVFEGRYEAAPGGGVLPRIRGRAWITAEGTLHLDATDPFRDGIAAAQWHAPKAVVA